MSRWTKAGVLNRMFEELQRAQVVRIKIEAVSLDSTSIKVHPDGTEAQKNGPQTIDKSRSEWNTKIHMVAADARTAVTFCLLPGQAHDAPDGRRLLNSLGPTSRPVHVLMDSECVNRPSLCLHRPGGCETALLDAEFFLPRRL